MRLIASLLAAAFALSATAGEAQLLPVGKFAARDGRPGPGKQWSVSDTQGAALAAAINTVAAQTRIVIDYDHQTIRAAANGQPAPAAGWILSAEWRPGKGLFAKVEWTAAAKAAIDAKEYLYISPVIESDADTGEVTGVLLAALVNHPALLGMEPVVAQLAAQFHSPDPTQQEPSMTLLAALIAALAINADAKDADVIAAVTAMKAQAAKPPVPTALSAALGLQAGADEATALSALDALKTSGDAASAAAMLAMQGQLAALGAQITGDKRKQLIDSATAAGKLLPAMHAWAATQTLEALQAFIAVAPSVALQGQTGGTDPTQNNGVALSTAQLDVAKQLGLDPAKFAEHLKAAQA
jgi:phage I-like protein